MAIIVSIEGQLTIEIQRRDATVSQVHIHSTRPMRVASVFEGCTPDEALMRLPSIYSVCATAQASAALGACEQALSREGHRSITQAREMLVLMETAREHLLRILLDWPAFLHEPFDRDILPQVTGLQPRLARALFGTASPFTMDSHPMIDHGEVELVVGELHDLIVKVLGDGGEDVPMPMQSVTALDEWMDKGEVMSARLLRHVRDRGWTSIGHCDQPFLPVLEESALHQRFTAVDAGIFVAAPCWEGRSHETTPLGRQREQHLVQEMLAAHGNGLLTRLTARLVELSSIPIHLHASIGELEPDVMGRYQSEPVHRTGIGLAQVEAARGRLIHRVEIEDGVIRRYQILAPTEWNFHPRGAVARGLLTIDASDERILRQQTDLLINAVDPCVGYELLVH